MITAEDNMGEYGESMLATLVIIRMALVAYTAGRGYVDKDTMASGIAVGVWRRDGVLIIMDELVNINDGSKI